MKPSVVSVSSCIKLSALFRWKLITLFGKTEP